MFPAAPQTFQRKFSTGDVLTETFLPENLYRKIISAGRGSGKPISGNFLAETEILAGTIAH